MQINTASALAITYNDRSPQENHHLATLFRLLHMPGMDVMSNFSNQDRKRLRKVRLPTSQSSAYFDPPCPPL